MVLDAPVEEINPDDKLRALNITPNSSKMNLLREDLRLIFGHRVSAYKLDNLIMGPETKVRDLMFLLPSPSNKKSQKNRRTGESTWTG